MVKPVGHCKWEALCDCGTTTYVYPYDVRMGHTGSCGCLQREQVTSLGKKKKLEGVGSRKYHPVVSSARYVCRYSDGYQGTYGDFTYNGLDRVDNTRNHAVDNVVPCCTTCNWMKSKSGYDEFLAHIKRNLSSHFRVKVNGSDPHVRVGSVVPFLLMLCDKRLPYVLVRFVGCHVLHDRGVLLSPLFLYHCPV